MAQTMEVGMSTDGPEPMPGWYWRKDAGGCVFGYFWPHCIATVVYVLAILAPLAWIATRDGLPFGDRRLAVAWGLLIAIGYPAWSWLETRAFEEWVRAKDKTTRDRERAYFKLMSDHGKTFWGSVVAIYAIAAFLGVKLSTPATP
jgi:hypothetical protein